MKLLRQLLVCACLAGSAGAALGAAALPAHYSFMDVYRLAVLGNPADDVLGVPPAQGSLQLPSSMQFQYQAADYQVRVASAGAQPAMPVFTVAAPELFPAGLANSGAALPAPSRWLLILSGLALAGWVARRKLGYSL